MSSEERRYKVSAPRDELSRYKNLDRIVYKTGVSIIETPNKENIIITKEDKIHIVSQSEENRLDIIAYAYYNNSNYYWVIAKASGITNPLVVPQGTKLRIPPISSILGGRSSGIIEKGNRGSVK